MNKAGLFGKLILGIIVAIILILAFIGFSIYQAYSSVNIIKDEIVVLKNDIGEILDSKNCSKMDSVYGSQEKIFFEINYVCKNPLLKWTIKKIKIVPFKCEDEEKIKESFNSEMEKFENMCISGNNNFVNNSMNISIEELSIENQEIILND